MSKKIRTHPPASFWRSNVSVSEVFPFPLVLINFTTAPSRSEVHFQRNTRAASVQK